MEKNAPEDKLPFKAQIPPMRFRRIPDCDIDYDLGLLKIQDARSRREVHRVVTEHNSKIGISSIDSAVDDLPSDLVDIENCRTAVRIILYNAERLSSENPSVG